MSGAHADGGALRLEHGWLTEDGYLCDGCNVRDGHEHRCHGGDGGPTCTCEACHPSEDAVADFMRREGLE